jgi:hypothetical protein
MDYPDHLSRLSTAFRLVLAIPVALFLYLLQYGAVGAMWAAILVKGRIPHWLFEFQVSLNRFTTRATGYFLLLTDLYPAFEGAWPLDYEVAYPNSVSRWKLVIWKFITAIPHFVVLVFLGIAVSVVVVIAWFAILFTGRFPEGLHRFVLGVVRWSSRVSAYVISLTDDYPPFSLDDDAGPASSSTVVLASVLGVVASVLVVAGIAAGVTAVYIVSNKEKSVRVSYVQLLDGDLTPQEASIEMDDVAFTLIAGDDSASFDILRPSEGNRLVSITLDYVNLRATRPVNRNDIEADTIRLRTTDGDTLAPILLTADGVVAPLDVPHGQSFGLHAIFEVPTDEEVAELRGYPVPSSNRRVVWEFE